MRMLVLVLERPGVRYSGVGITDNCHLPDTGPQVELGFSGRADCALNP